MNTLPHTIRTCALTLSGAGLLTLLTACGSPSTPNAAPSPSASASQAAQAAPTGSPTSNSSAKAWSYTGDTGPEYWGELDTNAVTCGAGAAQSPVDVAEGSELSREPLLPDYSPSEFEARNSLHSVEFRAASPQTIEVAGTPYTFKQLHYHAPSEHTVDGEPHDAEFHLVHQSPAGDLAVVGVLVDEGERNEEWAPLIDAVPRAQEEDTVTVKDVDLGTLLPQSMEHHTYMGSLTTPPCTENVRWLLLQDTVEVSQDQLRQLRSAHTDNNRPTQPLNDRTLAPTR